MGFLIVLLSVFMVLDCLLLILLVLMQLPKKEAGAGLAFGGAATDALFGAGSGNFLTKATKYIAVVFFALAILLSLLQNHRVHQPGSQFRKELKAEQGQPIGMPAPPPAPESASSETAAPATNLVLSPGAFSSSNAAAPTPPSPPAGTTNSAVPK